MIPLSCTNGKLHPGSDSSAVASKLDLLRTKPHDSYAACEAFKGRYILRCCEIPCSRYLKVARMTSLSWKRHFMAVASELDLLRTQVSRFLMRIKSRGSPNAFTPRPSLSRYSGESQTPQSLESLHAFGSCWKKALLILKIPSSHPGISSSVIQLRLAENYSKLIVQ